ncbi:hypothetical protein [Candidatus Vampirococcus lugosii]|uniref:Uncharacterized protein n=1 Tax=Candidatus Vampirococcus lugosii TaxID=2789015 RepID=A0ABS5QKQ4_9BACT|nr:hypothetical protein [Candidatus Vampirococcus lugosii]MBS8121796.1 hypothetical protein [Candidatus Vampirococcus lugosii]
MTKDKTKETKENINEAIKENIKKNKKNLDKQIDLYVLSLLQNKFFEQNFGYINIYEIIDPKELQKIGTNYSYLRKRIFYNVGIGNLKFKNLKNLSKKRIRQMLKKNNISFSKIIKNKNGKLEINTDILYRYFIYLKITKQGIEKLEEIRTEIRNNKKFISRIKKVSEYFFETKKLVIGIATTISGIAIFIISIYQNYTKTDINKFKIINEKFHYDKEGKMENYSKMIVNNFKFVSEILYEIGEIDNIEYLQVSENSQIIIIEHKNGKTYYFEMIDNDGEIEIKNLGD